MNGQTAGLHTLCPGMSCKVGILIAKAFSQLAAQMWQGNASETAQY